MTDGDGIPISIGNAQGGNHNDLYEIIPEFSSMYNRQNKLYNFSNQIVQKMQRTYLAAFSFKYRLTTV